VKISPFLRRTLVLDATTTRPRISLCLNTKFLGLNSLRLLWKTLTSEDRERPFLDLTSTTPHHLRLAS